MSRKTYDLNGDLTHRVSSPPHHEGEARFIIHGRGRAVALFDQGEVVEMSASVGEHYRGLCDMYQNLWDREVYTFTLGDDPFPTNGLGRITWQGNDVDKQWTVYYRVTEGAFGRSYMEVYQVEGGFNVRKIFQGDSYGDVNSVREVDAGLAERLLRHYRLYFIV